MMAIPFKQLALLAPTLSLLFICGSAGAESIYKHVDEDGNVSFSDVTPGGSASEVELIEQNANIFDAEDSSIAEDSDFLQQRLEKKKELKEQAGKTNAWKTDLKAAQLELKLALQAQSNGVVAEEGDFIGSANGGARPSASYFKKLQELDERVDKARDRLTEVKKAKPRF